MFGGVILIATIYATQLRGGIMANGWRYDPSKPTVAMNSLPLNSRITICRNLRCAHATVTDRMSSRYGRRARRVDLSTALARKLGVKGKATVTVRAP